MRTSSSRKSSNSMGIARAKESRNARLRREESQRQLLRATRKRIRGRQKRGHRVRYKGRGKPRRPGLRRVPGEWVYGRLTNEAVFRDYARKYQWGERTEKQKSWYEEHRRGREPWLRGKPAQKPALRRRAQSHGRAREEARKCGMPTVGYGGKETYVRPKERIDRLRRMREVEPLN